MTDKKNQKRETDAERKEKRVRDLTREIERLKREIEEHLTEIGQTPPKSDRKAL
jgi:hypothetical protein